MQYYLFIEIDGQFFSKVELKKSDYTIGRRKCDICINNEQISRTHAYLVRIGDDYFINDGSPPPESKPSTAGTRILIPGSNPPEWQKKRGARLKNGDRVALGPAIIRYVTVDFENGPNSDSQQATIT